LGRHSAGTLSRPDSPASQGVKQQDRTREGLMNEVVMSVEVAASYDAITCHIMAFVAFVLAFVEKKRREK
jgi:hypothetical protein